MPGFEWTKCLIDMDGVQGFTKQTIESIPDDPKATMSFCHEYIHFLQVTGTVLCNKLYSRLIKISILGVLQLDGVIKNQKIEINKFYSIIGRLKELKDHQGADIVKDKMKFLMDEVHIQFNIHSSQSYFGNKSPWEIERQRVIKGCHKKILYGFITPDNKFRPFNIAFLAENMARQIDQWIKKNHNFNHSWNQGTKEDEIYQGIRNILKNNILKNLQNNSKEYDFIDKLFIDKLIVILTSLALATPCPDENISIMLRKIKSIVKKEKDVNKIKEILLNDLVTRKRLHADAYNEIIYDFQSGATRCMERDEYQTIHKYAKSIYRNANDTISGKISFADESINWDKLKELMNKFGIPAIHCKNDIFLESIEDIKTDDNLTSFLYDIFRVFH